MAYLFVHFTNGKEHDDENIYFSVSKDGLNFQDLGTKPFLTASLGTKGIRDPFIIYDEKNEKYVIIATDLNTSVSSWGDAVQNGSTSIFVWESKDLLNWSKEKIVDIAPKGAGCAWAPEAVYCREKEKWFVFFASFTDINGEKKHRIFGSFTDDFKEFSKPILYIESKKDIIDTDIVFDKGYYYRFSKDETEKTITIDRAKNLFSDNFQKIYSKALDGYEGLEGPEAYYLEDRKEWCLIADQYRIGAGYVPFVCSDLEKGDFRKLNKSEYDFGKRKKRHGGVIKISNELYQSLIEKIK